MPTPAAAEPRWAGLRRLTRDPLGLVGLVLVATVATMAIGADWLTGYSPTTLNVRERLLDPSWRHLLGTDHLGRDIFTRVVFGARIALGVALAATGLALVGGLLLGLSAGYGPRWLDNLLILVFDTVRSYPTIMFALAVVTLVGPSLYTIALVIVVTTMPNYGRIVRTQTLSLKTSEFVLAERSMGAGPLTVLAIHVLPNVVGPLLILASMDIAAAVAIEAGLSFLGLGVRPPTPSWGTILNDGYAYVRLTPWLIVAGTGALIVTTLGFTFLGEALRDMLDPKLRRSI
ncbi:MAG TPA: ABC transporter permease [Methylomirabilota bacterium]|nr:ABC transporter permease [Methylomirabilota bacterium]